ncbi:Polynucleotide adenylyltransferase family protein [Prunus dulcis]|uniref:Polynucleotide adenylyltransferase family protein n=1 Tax=Prunus dulcis TaxID=3755 RepID=A0A4Y1QP58_PRUDU|nr:Polynucleotide adenylyltransferase family protein [Prunus dulcis]
MRVALQTALLSCEPIFVPKLRRSCYPHPNLTISWFPTKTLVFSPCRAIMAVPSRPTVQVRDNIELNETEKKIFDRLLGTVRHFGLQNQLRVAGGWVRDKLLGKDCYDIDIALDNMLGSEFVEKVRDYLLHVGKRHKELLNPEQSKHLETARMRICDTWIDFVNLRCEEYCENSRIPTVQKYGTAEEDAYRRDLTINRNCRSEIWKNSDSFTQSPHLWMIHYEFFELSVLEQELKEAASCDEVKAALSAKISRERIGTEIDLMISGNQPVQAMAYICDLKLFWVVFSLHPKYEPAVSEGCDRLCVAYLDATWNLIQLIGNSTFNDEQRRLALYTAMFLPLRKTVYKDNKAKKIPVVNYIFRDSLKRKVSDAETVINVHYAFEKFLPLIPYFASNEDVLLTEVDWEREFVDVPLASKPPRFLLRELKDFWRVALLMSTLVYPRNIDCTEDLLNKNFELERRRSLFKAAEDAVLKLGLDKIWDVKPLVNGRDIMNVLQLKSGGPLVREWQQKILAWQLARPSSTADECLEWMRETHSKLENLYFSARTATLSTTSATETNQ